MDAALAEAHEKLEAAIRIAMERPVTRDEAREFAALERLVVKLTAKLGRDRVRRI